MYIYIVIIYNYIYNNVWIRDMEQRYGTEVWNGSFKEVWNGGMERGYGTGVVPELVPDLLFWLAPIYLWCYNNVGFLRFPASSSLKQFWHPYGFTKGPGNHHLPFCNCKMAPMQAIIDLVSTIHPGSLYIYISISLSLSIYLSNLSNLSIY